MHAAAELFVRISGYPAQALAGYPEKNTICPIPSLHFNGIR